MSHFLRLSALLAFRHSGLVQYSWCQALRESGGKKPLQFLHLRFMICFAIDLSSRDDHQVKGKSLEENVSRKKEGKKTKNFYADALEEDTGEGNDIFMPPVLMHFQLAGDTGQRCRE
jgi:hypothetical protein